MADIQTVETGASVDAFIETLDTDLRKTDARGFIEIMGRATGAEANMWGPAIIGFGKRQYSYASGRTGEMLRVGFSPRKGKFVLYLTETYPEYEADLLKLGKYTRGGGCVYVTRLSRVDTAMLQRIVERSWKASISAHPDL